MVLQDLGEKILSSLNKLSSAKQIDDKFFKEFMTEMIDALKAADVNQITIINFIKEIKSKVNLSELPPGISARKIIEREVINALVKMIDPERPRWKPEKDKLNIVMMVGLQGSGKTTTCTKLGNYYKKRGWKVGLIAADTFRAGAREQLMQNAQHVNIPYYVDFVTEDPVEVALAGVEKFKKEKFNMIIVDTSGRHMQESALFKEMQQLEDAINPDQVIFVLDGTIGQMAFNQAKAFSNAVGIGSIIVTKLDSDAKGGGALSAVAATNSPILFYGTGEDMSSLEVFEARSFVSRLLGHGDFTALARKMEEIDLDKQNEVTQQILDGHFTFREMYAQYKTLYDMGDFSSLIEMMGLKKILVVIDAMTDEEMDNPDKFKGDKTRKLRLARGTGLPPAFIQYVINEQKRLSKILFGMKKPILHNLINMSNNPNQMNSRNMQRTMDGLMGMMDKKTLYMLRGAGARKK
ncbi:Signal recognition particle [Tritrichomonas musculus]|uniref:signal-recognition-particle GTPase n=1 Tax=Tritrichomonas musculus TaxID=1915356 RepID=A0ABR2KNP0_9EUKA